MLAEIANDYQAFRVEVLNKRIEVDAGDSFLMNRLDTAFDLEESLDVSTSAPEQMQSVQGDSEQEVLANGLKAPRYLIEALNDLDRLWPGATLYSARPAIVAHLVTAQFAREKTRYPFCMNDDPEVPLKDSPCILKKGHRGRHQDNDDGSWPQK